jgi:hypothetical protein
MKPAQPDPDDEALAAALGASRVLIDAPEALVQRALQLFQPLARAAAAPAPAWLPRLRAVLSFDSAGSLPLAHGRRSAAPGAGGEVRQLLYALDDCDVDLRVAPLSDGRFALSGQLLGPVACGVVGIEPAAAASHAPAADAEPAAGSSRALLSEWGEFELPPLPPGAWRIWLELPERVIELPPLRLADDGSPLA